MSLSGFSLALFSIALPLALGGIVFLHLFMAGFLGRCVLSYFPGLLTVLEADAALGLVSGVRVKRKDTASRRLDSRLGNGFRILMLKDGATDTGCGLMAFRRQIFLDLPYFDHILRFLIALVLREGWQVRFVPVNHRPRLTGTSKYTNFGRLLVSMQDLLGVRWLQRRYRGRATIEEL